MTFVEFVRDLPPQMGPEQVRVQVAPCPCSMPHCCGPALVLLPLACGGAAACCSNLWTQHCIAISLSCRPRASTGATWLTGGAMPSRRSLRSASTRRGARFFCFCIRVEQRSARRGARALCTAVLPWHVFASASEAWGVMAVPFQTSCGFCGAAGAMLPNPCYNSACLAQFATPCPARCAACGGDLTPVRSRASRWGFCCLLASWLASVGVASSSVGGVP